MRAAAIGYNVCMETRVSGHSVYRTEYHIVWIPKYRRRILNPGVKAYVLKLFPKVLEMMPGCEIVEQNVRKDHLHLVMVIPPRYAVSDVVGRIKGVTGKYLRKKFSWLKEVYWKENIVWSPGYFVSTVGVDEDQILKYVRWQGRQDEGQAKLDLF
jgi:putative transposase